MTKKCYLFFVRIVRGSKVGRPRENVQKERKGPTSKLTSNVPRDHDHRPVSCPYLEYMRYP